MTTLYKLTDKDSRTRGGMQWGEGVSHNAANQGAPAKLCTNSVVHAYASPHLAVLMAPVHVDYYADALLWLAEGKIVVSDATKVGCRTLTTLRQIDKPVWTTEMRVEFAIRCALKVSTNAAFVRWADAWLDGSDRSIESAYSNAHFDDDVPSADYARAVARAAARDAVRSTINVVTRAAVHATIVNANVDLEAIADSIYASHNL